MVEANETNLHMVSSIENTNDTKIMSVKIQENRRDIFQLFLMFDSRIEGEIDVDNILDLN